MSIDDEVKARMEAALYASGRPLSIDDLARAAGIISKRKTLLTVRSLAKNINSNLQAIEVRELAGPKFVMQLRPLYNKIAKKVATKPLVPYSVLKTLSYIVYSQPISALELASYRGSQAYRHLKVLEELSFVTADPAGRTKIYRTTSAFSDYFGLSQDPQAIKEKLTSRRKFEKIPLENA